MLAFVQVAANWHRCEAGVPGKGRRTCAPCVQVPDNRHVANPLTLIVQLEYGWGAVFVKGKAWKDLWRQPCFLGFLSPLALLLTPC